MKIDAKTQQLNSPQHRRASTYSCAPSQLRRSAEAAGLRSEIFLPEENAEKKRQTMFVVGSKKFVNEIVPAVHAPVVTDRTPVCSYFMRAALEDQMEMHRLSSQRASRVSNGSLKDQSSEGIADGNDTEILKTQSCTVKQADKMKTTQLSSFEKSFEIKHLGLGPPKRASISSIEVADMSESEEEDENQNLHISEMAAPPLANDLAGFSTDKSTHQTYPKDTSNKENMPMRLNNSEQPEISNHVKLNANVNEPSRLWTVEDFQIGTALGRGKFGNVYRAVERRSKTPVALKVLFKQIVESSPCGLPNLRREVEIQARLVHPSILRMFCYFWDQKNAYLGLEFAPNGELYKELVKRGGFIPVEEAAVFAKQLAQALVYLQERHVIHRDIKPENVLLGQDGRAKIADFGWAIHAPPPYNKRSTICGTPEYICPEIISGKMHDYRVDVWSYGILCYEMIAGSTPFAPTTVNERKKSNVMDEDNAHAEIYSNVLSYSDILGFPMHVESEHAKCFIRGLIKKDAENRSILTDLLRESLWLNESFHRKIF